MARLNQQMDIKRIIGLLLFFATQLTYGQYVLKGKVVDENDSPLPGARISVQNTTYGVPTNRNGEYYLEFNTPDTIIITTSMLGFQPTLDTITFTEKVMEMDVKLYEQATALNTVEIYADKRDIAKEVMKNVIDNKKNSPGSMKRISAKHILKQVWNVRSVLNF